MRYVKIHPRWKGQACVVAATGPSLTAEQAEACRGLRTIAVNDAWSLFPWAEVLYACDASWWSYYGPTLDFVGERWSSQGPNRHNDKSRIEDRFELNLVDGRTAPGFSFDPRIIHYGANSGFQAVNLALHFGATPIILLGFDMGVANNKRHFFGDHPPKLARTSSYRTFISAFETAARFLPKGVKILNATPRSALACFPRVHLPDALKDCQRELTPCN